ncbi:TatD family hydrolase [Vibrio kagoshimensis]
MTKPLIQRQNGPTGSTMTNLFDTHCHLDFEVFSEGVEQYLADAGKSHVTKFMVPAIGKANWARLHAISKQYRNVYFAVGFHPYFLDDYSSSQLESLRDFLIQRSGQCVAIGECGLDFAIGVDMQKQEDFFVAQLTLADEFKLPIIVHERQSHNRLIQLIKQNKFKGGGVVHGFSGSKQQALEWIKLGFFIGVGGTITYPRAKKTRTTISELPLESLVLETDAPDMPFNGLQGQLNHSKYLEVLLNELALLRKETKQSVAVRMWQNSHLLFDICE